MIRRLLVVFVAALSAWLGLANPGAALVAPATPVQTYTYDVHLHPAAMTTATSERGPPASTASRVPTYNAVGLWPNGPSARPSGSATAAIYDYGDVRRLVQSDSITWMHGGEATGALSSLLLTGVAAKTESRLLDDVAHLPCNCFVAGTKVKTADGEKPIEDIEVGDKVWARDLETGKNELRTVSGLFHKHADQVMTITVADGARVTVTEEHPFYVAGLGWVMSGDLRVGDQLAQRDGGSTTITAIDVGSTDTTVYNFTVDGDHNYYVTEAQLLVHNCDLGASIAGHMGSRRLADVYGSTEAYIESVIHGDAPLAAMRSIGQSGRAIWRDGRNIIIRDPMSVDGGTAFSKPSVDAAIRYFEDFE